MVNLDSHNSCVAGPAPPASSSTLSKGSEIKEVFIVVASAGARTPATDTEACSPSHSG